LATPVDARPESGASPPVESPSGTGVSPAFTIVGVVDLLFALAETTLCAAFCMSWMACTACLVWIRALLGRAAVAALPDAVLLFANVVVRCTIVSDEVDALWIAAARVCWGKLARFTRIPMAVENATFQAEQRVRCGRKNFINLSRV